jgi:large subunit ribosomal protein L22
MKAFLKNYRQSPRKVRLVAGLIKGKRVADANIQLSFLPKRASLPVLKLLNSAIANAKQAGVSSENLFISSVTVDKGIVMKRSMPRARGSASRINKRTSHVVLTLSEKAVSKPKAVKAKKESSSEKKVAVSKSKTTKKVEAKKEN